MEAAAAVETSTVNHCRSMKSTTCHSRAVDTPDRTMHRTVRYIATSTTPRATPARMTVPRTSVPTVRHAPTSQPSRTVEPWAGSDEDAAYKPVRTIVAVRRAGVRSISVISVCAGRHSTNRHSDRPHPDSHADLRLRISKGHHHQHRQQRNIFCVLHTHLPGFESSGFPIRKPFSISRD